ncbi:MAG: hypothetical protein CHACPFDD_00827 [Phycisphaerae bacterium]|nr:hypothetical protein [Phycisphaerae bacterium]
MRRTLVSEPSARKLSCVTDFSARPLKFFSRRRRRAARSATHLAPSVALLVALLAAAACRPAQPEVVVYTSVDEQFARQILGTFEARSGVRVQVVTDSEAGKTSGLVRRLAREVDRPRCDVWWSSEIFGTIELARLGALEPYKSPAAADIPVGWKHADGLWTGCAARARVLAFDPRRVRRADLPASWRALAKSPLLAQLAFGNPQFGTTRGHFAACFALWGSADGAEFARALKQARGRMVDGNSLAVREVIAGTAAVCMTDTDDVWVAQQRGEQVEMTYPDVDADAGPIWIPCSVALVRGGPHPAEARRLIDYLVSADVELALLRGDSRNVPVRPALAGDVKFDTPAPVPLPFEHIADALEESSRVTRELFVE